MSHNIFFRVVKQGIKNLQRLFSLRLSRELNARQNFQSVNNLAPLCVTILVTILLVCFYTVSIATSTILIVLKRVSRGEQRLEKKCWVSVKRGELQRPWLVIRGYLSGFRTTRNYYCTGLTYYSPFNDYDGFKCPNTTSHKTVGQNAFSTTRNYYCTDS